MADAIFERRLGRSGLMVSALGMGCWAIGGPWTMIDHPAGWGQVDDAESLRALQRAFDLGVNFFDTAANYGCGHSERLVGKAFAGRRSQVIIATKFGYQVDEEHKLVVPRADVVEKLRQDCEDSLRRLGSDYIDLYQLHVGAYPPEKAWDVVEELEKLVAEGKVRWYGWSTDNPAGARAFAPGDHCTAIQHQINMGRDAGEILEICEQHDLASVNRSPLGMGVLTGKFDAHTSFAADDIRSTWNKWDAWYQERLQQVERLRARLTANGRSLAQAALAWLWARSPRTVPIPGFKSMAQVEENIAALRFGPLEAELMAEVEMVFGRA